jgi:hypothetical protein
MMVYKQYNGLELTEAEAWEPLTLKEVEKDFITMGGDSILLVIQNNVGDDYIAHRDCIHDLIGRGHILLELYINDKEVFSNAS